MNYELIVPESDVGRPIYELVDRYVHEHHDHLAEARIAVAWAKGWTLDTDGHLKLGQMRKSSDLERELHDYDLVILLLQPFWEFTSQANREWLIDHELEHAELQRNKITGLAILDERGRQCFRLKKHDVEEFFCILDRHPLSGRVTEFVARMRAAAGAPFVACDLALEAIDRTRLPPEVDATIVRGHCDGDQGWFVYQDTAGVERRTRCSCWTHHQRLLATAREVLAGAA